MHMTLQLALLAAVVCAASCEPAGAPGRVARAKQPRATRGFKNTEMMTARGFGKRTYHAPRTDFGGLDGLWEMLESSQERGQQEQTEDKATDSVPVDWFVDEMLNNPELAKTVVRKFLDLNQDGTLSPDELIRNNY